MARDKKTKKEMIRVQELVTRIKARLFGQTFKVIAEFDKKFGKRIYLRVLYSTICTRTDKEEVWGGRKWYLSKHMLDDEIVKTAYAAFRMAVEHEVMEGFSVDDKILFNPHTNYLDLLKVHNKEVTRDKPKKAKEKAEQDGSKELGKAASAISFDHKSGH